MTAHPIPRCPHGHYPDEVVVYPPDYEIGILVGADGSTTNRWEDGTVGLTATNWEDARNEEDAYCPDHHDLVAWVTP